jgi:MFS family permease
MAVADADLDTIDPADENNLSYRGWLVVFASMFALTVGPSTIVMNFGVFIGPIRSDFDWTITAVAFASTILSYTIVVASPLQGYLVDRFGARRVILCCVPTFALSVFALSRLPPIPTVYYATWVLVPLLGVGLFPLAFMKVVGTWFRSRLGLALGITNAGIGLGGFLIPLVATPIILAAGWRSAYMWHAAAVLFLAYPLIWLFVREKDAGRGASAYASPYSGLLLGEAAKTRTFIVLAFAFLLLGLINTALIVQQVPILQDAGVSLQRAVLVQSTYGLCSLIGRLITGYLLDKFRASRVMILFVLGACLACTIYAMGATSNVVFLSAILIGLAFGAEFDVLAYMIRMHFGLKSFGKIYGVIFAIFQFGAGIGAAALPFSRDSFGSCLPGLWMFAAIALICAMAFLLIRDRQRGEFAS